VRALPSLIVPYWKRPKAKGSCQHTMRCTALAHVTCTHIPHFHLRPSGPTTPRARRAEDVSSPQIPAGPMSPDPFAQDADSVRRRSVLAAAAGGSHADIDDGKYPTNEEVLKALQVKVAKSVEVARRYRRVLWYSLFVALYLVVLYLQAAAYKSADVVSTLRSALMVDSQLSMTFNNEDEVLAYLGNKILLPTWKDPICGDGACPCSCLSSACNLQTSRRCFEVSTTHLLEHEAMCS
jgi:hypothetical protein